MPEPLLHQSEQTPFERLPLTQQASLYAWYANLPRAEARRVDALADEAFEAAWRASERT